MGNTGNAQQVTTNLHHVMLLTLWNPQMKAQWEIFASYGIVMMRSAAPSEFVESVNYLSLQISWGNQTDQ